MEIGYKPRVGNGKVVGGVGVEEIHGENIPGQGYSLGKGVYGRGNTRHLFTDLVPHPSILLLNSYQVTAGCQTLSQGPGVTAV